MDTKQLNKQAMYQATANVLSSDEALWSSMAGFARQVTALQGVIDTVAALGEVQEAARTGITADKQRITGILVTATLAVAGALAAWAAEKKNQELRTKVDFSRSDLHKLRDQQIGDRARMVHKLATENVEALAEFGVGPLVLEGLKAKIDAYDSIVGAPRDAQVKTATVTEALKEQFTVGDEVLNNRLDKLMEQFRESRAQFFSDYQNARKIVDRGGAIAKPAPQPAPAGSGSGNAAKPVG